LSFQIKQTMIINELPSNKYAANHIYSNIGQVPYPFSPYFCIVNKPIEYMETKKTTREEYQKCVNAVVDYINLHLGEEIDLKSLAKISHFSPFYFHRIMKAFLGEPVGTFIVRTRTETAARLLRYTDLPIADIAYRIGYSSSSSLSKVFKQFYGISPLEYRNNKNFVIMKPAIIHSELKLKREIKELPVRNMIYIRLFGDYKLNDYCGTWMRLQQFVQEEKLPMGEVMPYCIFHDDPKVTPIEKLRTDVCMVMPAAVTPKGNIGFKQLPAGRYAIFLYKGSYEHLQSVYDTIYGKYIPEMECTFRDEASAERYLNHPADTAPDELLTEIYIPIE
jgi:AraC family transcriptional regulator